MPMSSVLRIPGATGGCLLRGYEGWFELSDYAWGAQRTGQAVKGTGLPLTVSTITWAGIPTLMTWAIAARSIASAELQILATTTAGRLDWMQKIELADMIISDMSMGAGTGGSEVLKTTWSLTSYSRASVSSRSYSRNGWSPTVTSTW